MAECDILDSTYAGRDDNKLFTKLLTTRILVIITYLKILKIESKLCGRKY